jgi:hypothetical protein
LARPSVLLQRSKHSQPFAHFASVAAYPNGLLLSEAKSSGSKIVEKHKKPRMPHKEKSCQHSFSLSNAIS